MKLSTITSAQSVLDQLDRYCDLWVTFELDDTEQKTRCYVITSDEDMWSQHIKNFNIQQWFGTGIMTYGKVFECCQGTKRHMVYVHTPMFALMLMTQDPVAVGSKLIEVDYI